MTAPTRQEVIDHIRARLLGITQDPRLQRPFVTIEEDPTLAVEQLALENQRRAYQSMLEYITKGSGE